MESLLKNSTKKSLKRLLKESHRVCEECLGEGCESCDKNEHHNMSHKKYGKFDREEYMLDEKLKGKQHKLDRNKNGRIDAEDFKMMRKGKKQYMDEDMDVMDAIATGQDYLSATRDLDRDGDQTCIFSIGFQHSYYSSIQSKVRCTISNQLFVY